MAFITTPTNIDYLIPNERFYIGDLDGTLFSDILIRTALVYGVKYLQRKWDNRYLVFASGMLINATTVTVPQGTCTISSIQENDVFRNCYATFASASPPVIDQNDETPILIAAAILLRRSQLTASSTAFSSWSTPDLSYSNIQSSKIITDMLKNDLSALDAYFKGKLGRSVKDTFPMAVDVDYLPYTADGFVELVIKT